MYKKYRAPSGIDKVSVIGNFNPFPRRFLYNQLCSIVLVVSVVCLWWWFWISACNVLINWSDLKGWMNCSPVHRQQILWSSSQAARKFFWFLVYRLIYRSKASDGSAIYEFCIMQEMSDCIKIQKTRQRRSNGDTVLCSIILFFYPSFFYPYRVCNIRFIDVGLRCTHCWVRMDEE